MGKRYLRVEVSKELVSDVFLEVDEEDPRFRQFFQEPETIIYKTADGVERKIRNPDARLRLPKEVHEQVLSIAEDLDSLDWDDAGGISATWYPDEIEEKAARDYHVDVVELPQEEKKEEKEEK